MKIGSKLRTIVIKNPYVPKVHGERKDKDIHHYKLVGKTSYLLLGVTEKGVRETFNYADVIAPGLTVGSHPGGQYGRVYGIVEFEDGVERVDPPNIKFIDEPNVYLMKLNELNKEQEEL